MKNKVDFAFILHPLQLEDIFRKFKFMRRWPKFMVNAIMRGIPPFINSKITGIASSHGTIEGCFVGLPLTSEQMLKLPPEVVTKKIIAAGKKATSAGAKIVGLGAMTAVVGDAGVTVARNLNIAVTTGNSYTVATALEGTQKAVSLMGMDLERVEVVILGATGSIGSACARILARKVNHLTLIARDSSRLEKLAEKILKDTGLVVKTTSNINKALPSADVVISVSSAAEALIEPDSLKSGAVVCDVARPRDVSVKVAERRDDVLIIEGGVIEVPGDVNFNFNFGFPPQTAYACMAETMILALENRNENYSLGRNITVEQIDEISRLAAKHGFKLAGFRSFEKALRPEDIKSIKEKAAVKRNELRLSMV